MRQLRSQRNSIITTFIFGAIILTFVLWGGFNDEMGSPSSLTTVNGEEIPYTDFQRQVGRQLEMYGQALGGGKPLNEQLVKLIERQVIASLVMEAVMAQKAQDLGVVVGDQELLKLLQENKAFQDPDKGRFSPQVYTAVLEANGLNPAQFEKSIRRSLAGDRLRELLEASLWTSDAEVAESARLQNQSMTLETAVFDPSTIKRPAPSETELKSFFESHQTEFLTTPQRKGVVASIAASDIESKIQITQADLTQFFETQVQNSTDKKWTTPHAHAFHILISDTSSAGLAKAKAAKDEILKVSQDLRLERFRAKAAVLSEDYSNASQGGDLGYFDQAAMVKPFSNAVFGGAKVGSILGPIKTDYGYHIIYLADLTGPQMSFEAKAKQMAKELIAQRRGQQIEALKEKAQRATVSSLKESESNLRSLGFTWSNVGPVDLQTRQEGLPFMVLQDFMARPLNEWSDATELQGSVFLYRVTEELPAKPMTFDQARPKIRLKLADQQVEALIRQASADLISGKTTWSDLKKLGAQLASEKVFKTFQATQIPTLGESEALLRAAQGLNPDRVFAGPLVHDGKWVILKGSNFSDSKKPLSPDELKRAREELASKKRVQLLTAVQDLWTKDARIPEAFRSQHNL